MNIITNHDGQASTGRMISPFVLALIAFLLAAYALDYNNYLVMALGLVGVTLVVWWLFNLVDWLRWSAMERREREADIHPLVKQYRALAELEAARTNHIHAIRTLDAAQVQLARELGVVPVAIARGGNDTLIGTWLELGSARIPWAFCADWIRVYNARGGELPPVRYWSDSRAREYAQAILDWLTQQSAVTGAAGNRAAAWSPALTEAARRAMLERSGVTWAAYWWDGMTGNTETEE